LILRSITRPGLNLLKHKLVVKSYRDKLLAYLFGGLIAATLKQVPTQPPRSGAKE
jgi:hypothetical protein